MRVLLFLIVCVLGLTELQAQEIPRAFVLGTNEAQHEKLIQEHKQMLWEVHDKASQEWLEMMKHMEAYADSINYNIDGIKVLLHVFFNADGSIAHIGYFIRPNSRNVPASELTAFFAEFSKQYQFSITSNQKFVAYAKASFPTYEERAEN
jgi:hypothetical protein